MNVNKKKHVIEGEKMEDSNSDSGSDESDEQIQLGDEVKIDSESFSYSNYTNYTNFINFAGNTS